MTAEQIICGRLFPGHSFNYVILQDPHTPTVIRYWFCPICNLRYEAKKGFLERFFEWCTGKLGHKAAFPYSKDKDWCGEFKEIKDEITTTISNECPQKDSTI